MSSLIGCCRSLVWRIPAPLVPRETRRSHPAPQTSSTDARARESHPLPVKSPMKRHRFRYAASPHVALSKMGCRGRVSMPSFGFRTRT